MASTADRWLEILYPKLVARASKLKKYDDYYNGDHPLPFLTQAHAAKMRTAFRQMLEESRSNFMRLLIDVVDERMLIEGIRLSADSDSSTDKDSWDIWQANGMDSLSRAAILDSLIKGISYVSVWPDADKDGYADIAVEDALQTIVAYTPGTNFKKRDAALKCWREEHNKIERANIYLPDQVVRYQREIKSGSGDQVTDTQWSDFKGGESVIDNPLGVVPIIPIRNRGRLLVEGESEISDSMPVQNQINGFLFLLALAGYFGAHKQRWATGLTLVEDEETGEVKEPFDVAIDKMLVSEEEKVKFGEFSQTDLDGYIKAIDQKIQHLAITTRTPKHYLLASGADPSGDAIKSSESGLVRRVERKCSAAGESFEEILRLARKAQDGEDTPVDSEVVWADPSTESDAVQTDATIKKYQAGLIPKEQALSDLGYSQTTIARISKQPKTDFAPEPVQTQPVQPTKPPANGSTSKTSGT